MAMLLEREKAESMSLNELDFATNVSDYLDNLFDKSTVVKANSMEQWLAHFTEKCDVSLAVEHATDLVDVTTKCISRLEVPELSCDLLSVVCLLLGVEYSDFAKDIISTLKTTLNLEQSSAALKSKIIKTLALVSFVWNSEDADNTMALVQKLNSIISDLCDNRNLAEDEVLLVQTALHIWTFLLTIVDDDHVLEFLLESPILSHISLVITNTSDYNVKYAGGKALAYVSSLLDLNFNDPDIGHYDNEFETEIVLENLRVAKKPKKYTGISLVEIVNSIQHSEAPAVDLTVNGKQFDFTTWGKIAQIDLLRSVTKSGFLTHLQLNETIQDILEIGVEGRVYKNKNQRTAEKDVYEARTKNRDQNRSNDRQKKQNYLDGGDY